VIFKEITVFSLLYSQKTASNANNLQNNEMQISRKNRLEKQGKTKNLGRIFERKYRYALRLGVNSGVENRGGFLPPGLLMQVSGSCQVIRRGPNFLQ